MKSLDLFGWLERNEATPEPAAVAPQQRPVGLSDFGGRLGKYAAAALEKEAATVATATVGGRNHALNRASLALGELIAGGELTRAEVETTLGIAARSIGLDDHEITATMASGIEAGMRQPRNLDHVGNGGGLGGGGNGPGGKPPGGHNGGAGPPGPGECEEREGYEDNPHALARKLRGVHYAHPDGPLIRYWSDEFHVWRDGCYRKSPKGDIRAQIAMLAANEFDRVYDKQIAAGLNKEGDKPPRPIPVTTNLVNNVLLAVTSLVPLPLVEFPRQPCWIDGEAPAAWPVEECVPTRNAIVHLPSFADNLPCTRKPTPRLFCPYVLDYDFAPDAPQPCRWLEFLGQLWPDDPESIETLQEWMGLQLVPDLRYEKIMAFIGPRRAGKGTISDVMQSMVGADNCAGPTLSSLSQNFGMQSMVGKLSAVIDDARLSAKSDHAVIAERLLSVSGGGRLTIDRKYKDEWIGKVSARITLISNELPQLADASGALASRFIVLRFTESFYDREDLTLKETLIKTELPGIFRWAVAGWKRLRERGRFIQPRSGLGEVQTLKDLASPLSMFVGECCEVGPDEWTPCPIAFAAWRAWCESNNYHPGVSGVFGRNLRSVVPNLNTRQKRTPTGKINIYEGVSLKSVAEFAGAGIAAGEGGFTFDDAPGTPFD